MQKPIQLQQRLIDSALHEINEKGFDTMLNLKLYVADMTYKSSIS
ncbi:hypothetical protein [Rahnella perminowiae]|nr:hypothetical protein [Rahnella perminowiae]